MNSSSLPAYSRGLRTVSFRGTLSGSHVAAPVSEISWGLPGVPLRICNSPLFPGRIAVSARCKEPHCHLLAKQEDGPEMLRDVLEIPGACLWG